MVSYVVICIFQITDKTKSFFLCILAMCFLCLQVLACAFDPFVIVLFVLFLWFPNVLYMLLLIFYWLYTLKYLPVYNMNFHFVVLILTWLNSSIFFHPHWHILCFKKSFSPLRSERNSPIFPTKMFTFDIEIFNLSGIDFCRAGRNLILFFLTWITNLWWFT